VAVVVHLVKELAIETAALVVQVVAVVINTLVLVVVELLIKVTQAVLELLDYQELVVAEVVLAQ
jgi:hypothetical protein